MAQRRSVLATALALTIGVGAAQAANYNGALRSYASMAGSVPGSNPVIKATLTNLLAGQILAINVTINFDSAPEAAFMYMNLNGVYLGELVGGVECELGSNYCTYSATFAVDTDALAVQYPTKIIIGSPLNVQLVPFFIPASSFSLHESLSIRQEAKS